MGQKEAKEARNTDFAAAIGIGLDEALTSLEESFSDLTDDQASAFPIEGRNNIAWIVMHCLMNLDIYSCLFQTGQATGSWDMRWNWNAPRPLASEKFPATSEMLGLLRKVREIAERGLEGATLDNLADRRRCEEWWLPKTAADAYMRTIFHTMAHVRQIWLLRGALGVAGAKHWPRQHWA